MTLERTHTRAAPRRCARDSSLARRARSDARDVARERKMMGKTETFRTRVSSRIGGEGGRGGGTRRGDPLDDRESSYPCLFRVGR